MRTRDEAEPEFAPPRQLMVHGHAVSYRDTGMPFSGQPGRPGGEAPVLLLVHGLAGDLRTWDAVVPRFGRWARVIAPDLPGHGHSEVSGGDCSVAAYAAWLRDVLRVLDVPAVTVVGHSLGGGVAMQLAYLFPEIVERMVLISAGGLGREVNGWIRAATLPGAELVIPVLASAPVRAGGRWAGRVARAVGLPVRPGVAELARSIEGLADPVARHAFLRTARTSLTFGGQEVDARDRLYLTQVVPTQILWGARDAVLPLAHGRSAAETAVGSRLEVLEGAGHFAHLDEPERTDEVLRAFVGDNEPAHVTDADLIRLVRDPRVPG